MDPSAPLGALAGIWLPRASGDGPLDEDLNKANVQAAPRERGWTQDIFVAFRSNGGCPARAGMDPVRKFGPTLKSRLPRASGDGPVKSQMQAVRRAAAPRERGWTPAQHSAEDAQHGCPARAGMDPFG